MSNNYWARRMARAQDNIARKNTAQIEKQLEKYYSDAMKRTIADFESVYEKIMRAQAEGSEITPAWLYQLDSYWQAQAQLKQELQKLGTKSINALSSAFEKHYYDIYNAIAMPAGEAFATVDNKMVKQLINQIWCADGKSWSSRVWGNTDKLAETLNEQLIHCVATGKKTTELKNLLQERFAVSYNNADMITRTEIAHIQTQAVQQRYRDYGIEQVEVLVDKDEKTCPICAKHDGEKYFINDRMPVPFHPRCRCCMIPVIEDNRKKEQE